MLDRDALTQHVAHHISAARQGGNVPLRFDRHVGRAGPQQRGLDVHRRRHAAEEYGVASCLECVLQRPRDQRVTRHSRAGAIDPGQCFVVAAVDRQTGDAMLGLLAGDGRFGRLGSREGLVGVCRPIGRTRSQ